MHMLVRPPRKRLIILTLLVCLFGLRSASAKPKIDIDGKIVIANVDRYPAHFRVGTTRKKVEPKKASLLGPKEYPVTIEIWNGVRGRAAWERQTIPSAGVYTLRFQNGRWSLTKPSPRNARRTASSRYRRTTGTAPRVVRGRGRTYYGRRVPLIGRVAYDALWVYRFVRDEADRDLLREIIIGGEIDREIERELLDRLDDMAVNLPADDRREFERALGNLKNLSEQDIEDLGNVTDEEWGQVRDYLGDNVADDDWAELQSDFGDIEVEDLTDQELSDLGDAGIESLDSDIDFEDLGAADVDLGDLGGSLDNVNIGDLGGGFDNVELGDLGGGDFGGLDDGGFDAGGFDDFGGGFDDFGGGGFDDFGGGFDDFGGGFDDFGGGGFDDFGGGFDDF